MESSYRSLIKRKLADRCTRNAQYSLRALARDVRWDVSQLSRVLNGKQELSSSSAKILAEELFDSGAEKETFLALVEFETAKKPEIRRLAAEKLESLRGHQAVLPLQVEAFRVISDWYHVAILDYSLLEGADMSPEAISLALGLSELEARLALDRLLGLGLLEMKEGRLAKTTIQLAVPSGPRNQSVRMFHKQMITKALESVEGQNTDQRYLRAETLPLDSRDLGELKALVDDFGKAVQRISDRAKRKDALYQLNIQLFDLLPRGWRRSGLKSKVSKEQKS